LILEALNINLPGSYIKGYSEGIDRWWYSHQFWSSLAWKYCIVNTYL